MSRSPNLQDSASEGDLATVKRLIASGIPVDDRQNGQTALQLAAWYGQVAVVQWLLTKGADVHADDGSGWTPLHYAAKGHNNRSLPGAAKTKVAGLLLAHGARTDALSQPNRGLDGNANPGVTPAEVAEAWGYSEIAQLLKKPPKRQERKPAPAHATTAQPADDNCIRFPCPQCTRSVKAPATFAGKRGKCPACGFVAVVPAPPAAPAQLPVAPEWYVLPKAGSKQGPFTLDRLSSIAPKSGMRIRRTDRSEWVALPNARKAYPELAQVRCPLLDGTPEKEATPTKPTRPSSQMSSRDVPGVGKPDDADIGGDDDDFDDDDFDDDDDAMEGGDDETTAWPGAQGSFGSSGCPNCGASVYYGAPINLFRCACGKVYCDNCSGGGLVTLPRCPVSPYHDPIEKIRSM
jgi:hypothetical protein